MGGGKYTEVYVSLQNANACIFLIDGNTIDGEASDLGVYTRGELLNGSYTSSGIFTWTAKKNIKVKFCYGVNTADPNQVVYEQTFTTGQTVATYSYATAMTMMVQEA